MSVAPDTLPPVRPSDEDGPTKTRKKKKQRDLLCILAVLLGLAGVFPHAVDAVTRLLVALRGGPVALSSPEGKADAAEQERQRGQDPQAVHGADSPSPPMRGNGTPPDGFP